VKKFGFNHKILFLILLFLSLVSFMSSAQYYPVDNNGGGYSDYDYQGGENTIILDDFDFATVSQKETQWCWAACITMVLNYYDIPCTQEEVVMRTYGTLVNYPARDLYQIAQYLNGWGVDRQGRQVIVQAEAYSSAPFDAILSVLSDGRPFIIGVGNGYSGHVVVCYGVDWVNNYWGPEVTKFYVYDPWPDNGYSEWDTRELNMYWVGAIDIEVQDAGYNEPYYNPYNDPYDYYE